ncbi:serine hydrolase domain-containing protein [Streptomyces ossamyceticus]|uniref:serine hydrolase domain-containing protein n=1 Tax=Streptomyces ossamyceticus TaxID=249581 RepID=UPI0030B80D05
MPMSTRLIRTTLAGVTAVAAAATALSATPAAADPATKADQPTAATRTVPSDHAATRTVPSDHAATRAAMDAAVAAGVPGVVAEVRDARGVWRATSGVADLTTRQPRGAGDAFRTGSVTKSLVATVLLQLQAEGRLDLDATVDQYLPGLVRGNGHDGTKITVRQLMNHTSGVFNFTEDATFVKQVLGIEFLKTRYDDWTPEQVIALALRNPPQFEPGTSWKYSNTNYLLLGLIIEKLTGRPYADEIEQRVTRPLGMHATYFPGTDPHLPAPTRHYSTFTEDPGTTHDVTELNPSWAWAAGEMITDTSDLNRFYTALFTGRLLRPAQLRQMTDTVPTEGNLPSQRYGLGLIEYETTCGIKVWGHSGGIHGSSTQSFGTRDGRHMITLNFNGDWVGGGKKVVSAEFCPPEPPASPAAGD